MASTDLDHQIQLRTLASALERVCSINCDLRSHFPTVFDAVSVPDMSIHCYLVRLHRYTKFDFVCFHVAAWYVLRLCQSDSACCPTMHNVHRLLIAALLVASKATDDVFHANVFMAQCGGITVGELNKLEAELCMRLHWRLLPKLSDIHELMDALPKPQSAFWTPWYNANRVSSPPVPSKAAAEPSAPVFVTRLPHAKTVADSLTHFFGGGSQSGSNADLTTLADAAGSSTASAGASARAAPAVPTGDQRPSSGRGVERTRPHTEVAKDHQSVLSRAADGAKGGAGGGSNSKGGGQARSDDGSPRSITNRTFSFSNLFGLASW